VISWFQAFAFKWVNWCRYAVALARLQGAGAPDTVVEGDRGVCRVCGGMVGVVCKAHSVYPQLESAWFQPL
jgi:hypothetical protein